ncbi:MAG: class II aldolase/adducin family protein [Spirochaetales bacterium]|nr:class II aldolase/adducin family protein [Spirochaetales bacterium]
MKYDLMHPADQIVMIMERIYGYGMTTTSGGNLSILDDNGDIWITPGSVDKGSLTRKDIICIHPDGSTTGPHKPSVEYPFHKSVYDRRPDVRAVLHAHPPALIAFSIARKIPDTTIIPNIHIICGEVGIAEYEVPGSEALGENIASILVKDINTVILENHGLVTVADDLFQAFMQFETLDYCANLEIKSRQIGKPVSLTSDQIELASKKHPERLAEFVPQTVSSAEKDARHKMCELIHRAYDQRLFTSTQGTFSQRLSDDSFLITPFNIDRKYLEVGDIVRIDGGKREKGKFPSRSVNLHREIYRKKGEINSLIIAPPPNIMAFGITKEKFDTRTIPESYVMLRDIPVMEYGTNIVNPEKITRTLSEKTPILMIENECIIVSGSSLLNAFDRLEVAEFSAKAVISTHFIGPVISISDDEIEDLKKVFSLA